MMRERTRASSRIRLPTPCDGTSKYSIVERIFVGNEADDYGTKPEWHPPKEPADGKPVRVVAVAPHVRRGGSKCLGKKPCPLSETASSIRRRPLRKTCPKMVRIR